MLPGEAFPDVVERFPLDAIFSHHRGNVKQFASFFSAAYFADILIGQFSVVMCGAAAYAFRPAHVLCMSDIFQVVCSVVGLIAVDVVGVIFGWTWPEKCLSDEDMHLEILLPAILGDCHSVISQA